MNTYEVFLKKPGRDEFRHVGSLDAADPEMALMYARETHNRRAEGSEMWLVDRRHVLVADPESMAVNDHKPHRHNDGSVVGARRKENRKSEA